MSLNTREMREYQAKRRGGTSPKTALERLMIVAAWEAGEITEGLASQALGTDRVSARQIKNEAIDRGKKIAEEIHDAIKAKAERRSGHLKRRLEKIRTAATALGNEALASEVGAILASAEGGAA